MIALIENRAKFLYEEHLSQLRESTNILFGWLLALEYVAAIVWGYLASPLTWSGTHSSIHPHVIMASVLGALIAAPTCLLVHWKPSANSTRYCVAVSQMLMSSLLIHVSGGRIETHFHIFVSLAFLAFYRDWKILVPATAVILVDHVVRGIYFPYSIYGVDTGANWRFLEHTAWVVFEDIVLAAACIRGSKELWIIAERQAQLESNNLEIEARVEARTSELQRVKKRQSAILEHALDAIISIDQDGLITGFNPAAEREFELRKVEAVGSPFSNLLAVKDYDLVFTESVSGVKEGLFNKRVQTTGLRKGKAFPIELAITPVHVDNKTLFTAFVRDLTEQRKLETDLAHAQKMESIGQLAAGVAHEINTPNQYIGNNLSFIKDSFDCIRGAVDPLLHDDRLVLNGQADSSDLQFALEEVPKAIHEALEGVERVAAIVKAMKDFSHPGQEERTAVDLNRVINSTVTVARSEWKYYCRVDLNLEEDLPAIEGDPGELGQVFLNLLINSVHAVKERFQEEPLGVISISTSSMGDSVEITFSDNGCGIPEEAIARVFDPFFTTKPIGHGTGQGLAITHSVIVRGHLGNISFSTKTGEGTSFFVRLPVSSKGELAA